MKWTPKTGSLIGLEPRLYTLMAALERPAPIVDLLGAHSRNAVMSLLARGLIEYVGVEPRAARGRPARLYQMTDVGRLVLRHKSTANA